MSSSTNPLSTLSLLFLFIQTLSISFSQATVPDSQTFKFVNEGEFGPYVVEYGGSYRMLGVFNAPFQLGFYNTTPNAFTLALRMGTLRSESLFRWVWEANRGNPVRENATVAFGSDGNLALSDADGRVAWQTNTANKGVVGFKLLPDGNMVLYGSKGNFIWQSFDYPTDTLLMGQSFRVGSITKLVSRASAKNNSNGPYSFVLEAQRLGLYYKSPNSPKPLLYSSSSDWFLSITKGRLDNVTLAYSVENDGYAYDLMLEYKASKTSEEGNRILARPKYNSTLTFLRLGIDGNLRLYTYYDKVDWGAWEVTFSLFSRESDIDECQLPERCGKFGLCDDNQCVACPLATGLKGWSKDCAPAKVPSCKPSDFSYYRVDGVEHFVSRSNKGDGPMKEVECGNKCTKDCKCVGYFYHQDTMGCWTVYDLNTLKKVANSTHFGYIKVPKNKA